MNVFVDREKEVAALRNLLARPSSLALAFGQRRTGKTFLLQHVLAGERDAIYFLADETAPRMLLARFLEQVEASGRSALGAGRDGIRDWGTALAMVLQTARAQRRRVILVLDECQYILEREPSFPSVLQRLWDEYRTRLRLHVILCGSALGILSRLGDVSQPLHGRFDLRLRLAPFTYSQAARFVPRWRPVEQLRTYGAFGGLARHLAAIDPARDLGENVCAAMLSPLSPLHEAPHDLLRVERISSTADAAAVLTAVASGENRFNAIASRCGLSSSRLDYVTKELLALEILTREVRFGDRDTSRHVRYRCADPFVEFWFRFIAPNRAAAQSAPPGIIWRDRIAPFFDGYMGGVFERIAGAALRSGVLLDELGPTDAVAPFWSRDGKTQIDLVGRFGSHVLFVECKWRPQSVTGLDVLARLEEHVSSFPGRATLRTSGLCIASAGQFSPGLKRAAAAGRTLLLGIRELLGR